MRFKIIRIYKLEAESRYDAMKQFRLLAERGADRSLLTDEFATEDVKKSHGWLESMAEQLLGK